MLVIESEKLTQRKVAIYAGLAIIFMAVLAGFSYGFVHSSLIKNGDATTTFSNISQSIGLFRAGIFGWVMVLLLDILVAWALYTFTKQIDNSIALLGLLLRLSYSAILGIAISHLISITLFFSGDDYLLSMSSDQLEAQVMYHVNAFDNIWTFGLVLFGFHLLILGYLCFKSGFIHKIVGTLVIIAAISYIFIHSLFLFLPQIDNITTTLENVLTFPMAIGELSLGIWLLFKGGKIIKR